MFGNLYQLLGQIAIGVVECHKEDAQIHDLLKPLDDKKHGSMYNFRTIC